MKYIVYSLVFISTVVSANNDWPTIVESTHKFIITRPENAVVDIPIMSQSGKPAYLLKCRSGNYEEDDDFDYSGFLHCVLITTPYVPKEGNLLREKEHKSSDWDNRGRFLLSDLRDGCAQYPDWGAVRTFKLRNIELAIEIKNYNYQSLLDELSGYTLTVSIRNSSIDTRITHQSEYVEPPWSYGRLAKCNQPRK